MSMTLADCTDEEIMLLKLLLAQGKIILDQKTNTLKLKKEEK